MGDEVNSPSSKKYLKTTKDHFTLILIMGFINNKTHMITKTMPTPRIVNITFLVFVIIAITPFFAYIASANKMDDFCERNFNLSFRQPIAPRAYKKCKIQFERIETEWRTGLYTK